MNVDPNFIFKGETWRNCGASDAQESALMADQEFQKMLTSNYSTDFGQNESMMKNLNTNLQQIINKGAGQNGFTPAELATQNSQAINAAAAQNQKVQQQIGVNAAAHGTSTPGVESGVTQAERAAAASAADTEMNNQLADITQKNAEVGRQNFWNAVGEQEKLPGAFENPSTQMAGAVEGANNATSGQAEQNSQANNAWMGMVSGLAGDAATYFHK